MSPRETPAKPTLLRPEGTWLQVSVVGSLITVAVMVGFYGGGAATQLAAMKELIEKQTEATGEQAKELRVVQQQLSALGARLDRVEHAMDRR